MNAVKSKSAKIDEVRTSLEHVTLSDSEWKQVLDWLPSILFAYGPAAGYSMVRMVSKKIQRTTTDTNSALSLIFTLASMVIPSEREMPSKVFSEDIRRNISDQFANTVVPKILEEISKQIDELDELYLRNLVASSILPTFQFMHSHINLRAITAADFAPSAIESMEDADVYGLVPTATLAIVTDESNRKPLIFQAGRLGIVALIDQLKVVLRRLDSAKQMLETDESEFEEVSRKGESE